MLNINILSAFIYLEICHYSNIVKGNQWVTEFVVGHLSPHIKDIVSFPSGLEYLHQEGSANFKPGYLYVILLLFFLVALTFFFMWSLWSYGTLGHVCSTELRKKKSFQILFSLFLGLQTKLCPITWHRLLLEECVCLKA